MNDDELRRDIAEEDELRRLLHRAQHPSIPPFATVVQRARSRAVVPRALMGIVAAALVIIAAIVLSRTSTTLPVATSASPSAPPTSASSSAAATAGCALPSSLDLARHATSSSLTTSLAGVQPSDPQTNQMRWSLRFLSARDAAGPATVGVRVEIVAAGNTMLQVLGYELVEPERRSLADGGLVTIAPCRSAGLVVRTAGPLLDGTWPYVVTIEKIAVPEGRTVPEKLEVTLTCSNKSFTCTPAQAGATQPPTPTPNPAVLKPSFGVIYSGIRQGWDPGSAQQIRREGETTSVGELAGSYFNQFHGTVSPDGRRAVYPGQTQDGPWSLYLLDGARPNEQRRLLALPNEIPGLPVWSGDMTGIAFTVQDSGATQGVAPKYDSIRTLDLATGKVMEIARITDGSTYRIVGWDRRSGMLAALVSPHAAPASAYVVIGPSGTRTTALASGTESGWAVYGSPDARTVAGIHCEATSGCSLWTWPLADYGARADQHFGSNVSLGIIGWRPGTEDLALGVSNLRPSGGDAHIELWSASAGRRTVYTGGSSPPSSPFFRADGSALIVPGYGEGLVVDIATGATSPLPFPAPTGPYERALPEASIRLDVR